MASEIKRIRKPKPLPLARSLQLIAEERVNVARRTRERIALIGSNSEYDQDYSVDKATQTDIPLGCHTDWVGARIRCNSKIRYKPVKNGKITLYPL